MKIKELYKKMKDFWFTKKGQEVLRDRELNPSDNIKFYDPGYVYSPYVPHESILINKVKEILFGDDL